MNETGNEAGGGEMDLAGKINALKSQIASLASAVDEIAAAAGVESPVESEDPEEIEETEDSAGASAPMAGKMPFGKRKPGGMANALGIGG